MTANHEQVTTKYMAAAEIANKALSIAIDSCKADADVFDICQLVDAFVEEQAGKLYNKGKNKARTHILPNNLPNNIFQESDCSEECSFVNAHT